MLKLILAVSISFFLTSEICSEIIQRCSDSPRNICGSDLKLYKSECDFLRAKDLNSDLTILDMEDCFLVEAKIINLNTSNTSDSALSMRNDILNDSALYSSHESSSLNDGRSLRGSGVSNIYNNELHNNDTSVSYNNTGKLNIKTDSEEDSGNYVTYLNYKELDDDRVFKEIAKTNSKILKIVVDNFDISNFVIGNGKYNIKTISRAILGIILRIIRNHKSQIASNTDRGVKEINNKNCTSSDLKTAGVQLNEQEPNVAALEAENYAITYPESYRTSINVTLMFTDNYTESTPEFHNKSTNSPINENLNIVDSNKVKNTERKRSLIQSDLFFNGCTSNLPSKPMNVEMGFYCNFESNLNVTEKTRSIIDITNIILEENLENSFGLSGEKQDFFKNELFDFGNYFRGLSKKDEGEDNIKRITSYNKIINLNNTRESLFNYIDNKNDINIEIGELYVFFNFEGLKKDESEDYNLKYSGLFDENYDFSNETTLRITNENDYNVTDSMINETLNEYPGAFDRVRGQNCIVNCTDEVTVLYCASNGVTYKNICEFRNAQCNDKSVIFISFGECPPIIIRS
ncbi:hypothetical protein FG386_000114 [Cryptosporidium ryanae]|uniref:uncharacterized protein n=1 Tax=Cryptosporidium ryanae TaxID=515981 RepID=UPI00351A6F40|nr:hypothetical protein FG386_000114 [Cryptosporidium ryanae]